MICKPDLTELFDSIAAADKKLCWIEGLGPALPKYYYSTFENISRMVQQAHDLIDRATITRIHLPVIARRKTALFLFGPAGG